MYMLTTEFVVPFYTFYFILACPESISGLKIIFKKYPKPLIVSDTVVLYVLYCTERYSSSIYENWWIILIMLVVL